jgi:hypothetical protein
MFKTFFDLGRKAANFVRRHLGAQKLPVAQFAPVADNQALAGMKVMVNHGSAGLRRELFVHYGQQVLDSAQGSLHAHEVARYAAQAMHDKVNPNTAEVGALLQRAHQLLDKNIARRTAQARIIQDPGELTSLYTDNIRDARAIAETGAPRVLREDALKDIENNLRALYQLNPLAATALGYKPSPKQHSPAAEVSSIGTPPEAKGGQSAQSPARNFASLADGLSLAPLGADFKELATTRAMQEKPRPSRRIQALPVVTELYGEEAIKVFEDAMRERDGVRSSLKL